MEHFKNNEVKTDEIQQTTDDFIKFIQSLDALKQNDVLIHLFTVIQDTRKGEIEACKFKANELEESMMHLNANIKNK